MALDEFFACYEQEPRPRLTKATVSAWCWKSAGWDPRPQSCVPAAASEKVPGRAPQTFEPSRPDHPMRHGASVQIPEVSFYPWPMRHYGERPASHPSASAGRKRRLSSHRANAIQIGHLPRPGYFGRPRNPEGFHERRGCPHPTSSRSHSRETVHPPHPNGVLPNVDSGCAFLRVEPLWTEFARSDVGLNG